MVSPPTSPSEARRARTRRYAWLLALVVVVGVVTSLTISYALYLTAQRQWMARAGSDAQRLSSMLLGSLDESYTPLSGLAALVEDSRGTEPEDFLNALDGMESRTTTVLLGAAAMLKQDADGKWVLTVSSGNFRFIERDAADGFPALRPLIELARKIGRAHV